MLVPATPQAFAQGPLSPLPWAFLLQLFMWLSSFHSSNFTSSDWPSMTTVFYKAPLPCHSIALFLLVFLSTDCLLVTMLSMRAEDLSLCPPVFQDLGQHQALARGSVSTCEKSGSLSHTEGVSLGTWRGGPGGDNQTPHPPASAEHWLNTRPLTCSISSISQTPCKVGRYYLLPAKYIPTMVVFSCRRTIW